MEMFERHSRARAGCVCVCVCVCVTIRYHLIYTMRQQQQKTFAWPNRCTYCCVTFRILFASLCTHGPIVLVFESRIVEISTLFVP